MNASESRVELPVTQNNVENDANTAPHCNTLHNPTVSTAQGSINTSSSVQSNTFTSNIENQALNRGHYNPQNVNIEQSNSFAYPNATSSYQMVNNVPAGYGYSNMLPNNAFVGSYPPNNSYVMGGQMPNNSLPVHDPNIFQQYAPNNMHTQQMIPNNMYVNPQMQMQYTNMGNPQYPNNSSNVMNSGMYGYPNNVQNSNSQIALFVDSATGMQYLGEKIGDTITFTPHPAPLNPQFVPMQNTSIEPIEICSNNPSNMSPSTETQNVVPNPISPSALNNSPKKGKKMLYRNSNRTILPAENQTQRNTESLLVPVEPIPHVRKIKKKVIPNHSNNITRALLPAKRNKFEIGPEIICWTCRRTFENDDDRFRAHNCIKAAKERRNYCSRCFKIFVTVEEYYNHTCVTSDHLFNCNICNGRFKNVELLSKHSEIHTQCCVYNCTVCSLGFHSQMLLENHMQSHHYNKSRFLAQPPPQPPPQTYIYGCTICGITFPSREQYDSHMASSHNMNTQNCKTTVVPSSLGMHMAQNYPQIQDGQMVSQPQFQNTSMINYQQSQINPCMRDPNMYNGVVMSDGTVMYNTNPMPMAARDGNISHDANKAMVGSATMSHSSQIGTMSDTSLSNNTVVSAVSNTSALISGDNTSTSQQETMSSKDIENASVNNACSSIKSDDNSANSNENAGNSNENAVNSNENAVNSNENAVNSNENAVNSNENVVSSNENAVNSNENAVSSNENAVSSNDNAVNSNQYASNANCMTEHNSSDANVVPKGENLPIEGLSHFELHVQNGENEILNNDESSDHLALDSETNEEINDDMSESMEHLDSNQFSCNICQIAFQNAKHLSEHTCTKVSHNCGYCGKIFSGKYASRRYTKHLEIHPSELTFSCPLCPHKFRTSRQLKFHSKKHLYSTKSYCQLCNLTFKSAEALDAHDKIHKNMKACLTCPVCNAKFIYGRTLNKHLKDIHHVRTRKQKEHEEECTDDVE